MDITLCFRWKYIWYRRLGGILRLGKASIKGKQKHAPKMNGRISHVFDHNKKDKDFDICIKQKAV